MKLLKRILASCAAGGLLLLPAAGLCSITAHAEDPLLIPTGAGTYNGHYYMVFNDLADMSGDWNTADRMCRARGGHLATITDAGEDAALYAYVTQCGYTSAYFGLYFDGASWRWITGEEVSYFNWGAAEPNGGTSEPYGMYVSAYPEGNWNDGRGVGTDTGCYICEWDSGISEDAVQAYDAEGELILPEGTVEQGDSVYKVYNAAMTAAEAGSFCERMGGHLVFIDSEEEQTFLTGVINYLGTDRTMYWIGARELDGVWYWSGAGRKEPINYGHWSYNEPNNPDGESVYAVLNVRSETFDSGGWVAESNIGAEYRESDFYPNYGFICEWEYVCTGDAGRYLAHVRAPQTDVPATCTESGWQTVYCAHCGQELESYEVEASGHDYVMDRLFDKYDFNPIPGVTKYTCTKCGDVDFEFEPAVIYVLIGLIVVFIIMLAAHSSAKKQYYSSS